MPEKTVTPGRPAEFSREAAIEGAMHLFWRDGYLGVSTSELAAAMNIQRSSFYNSFGGRASVFREALERYSTEAPDRRVDQLTPGESVLPAIAGLFRELCRQRANDGEARGCLICNSVGELVGVDDELGPVLLAAVEQRVNAFERVLTQAAKQGELKMSGDAGARARSLVAFLLGINLLSKTVRNETALWATCKSFLASFGVPEAALKSLD